MNSCRACFARPETFLSLGRMPRGNGFLTAEEFGREFFFDLAAAFCPQCLMVQILEQPEASDMFHSRYPFFTGSSARMTAHFQQWAEEAASEYRIGNHSFVVEIGSNDGTFLEYFRQKNIPHLGIEPSSNVAGAARQKGVRTLEAFFDEDLAGQIVREHSRADLIFAANVMCHIPALHSVLSGISLLLKDSGIAVFEEPYLGAIMETGAYDQIYDEHVFFFSLHSMQNALERHGLELIHAAAQWTHGGSMRYFVAKKGIHTAHESVGRILRQEFEAGLTHLETFEKFRIRCELSRDRLSETLLKLKKQGKRVLGYGATSKSTTVLNYAGISSDLVECICDTTPEKQGKFTPGAHIPVLAPEAFRNPYPDCALLFAWNHAAEVLAKEREYSLAGGRWLVYVPEVKFL